MTHCLELWAVSRQCRNNCEHFVVNLPIKKKKKVNWNMSQANNKNWKQLLRTREGLGHKRSIHIRCIQFWGNYIPPTQHSSTSQLMPIGCRMPIDCAQNLISITHCGNSTPKYAYRWTEKQSPMQKKWKEWNSLSSDCSIWNTNFRSLFFFLLWNEKKCQKQI